jgi:prepilin-type N-terminal cleavage/methylation domain-containing protein
MKKNGFTLIELLAVIVVISLIMLIAIPNIVGLSTGVKKDQMLDDAKKLISLAKYKVNTNMDLRNRVDPDLCNNGECTLTFAMLNVNGDIENDPDGGDYESTSKVIYRINNNVAEYCITLIGRDRTIGYPTCVVESGLYSRSNVHDRQ